ncbi:Ger(x)C family spore germination protein [Clostridium sp. YIM B02505]|uniref:Ger(X)C family spore germination protein n=1 Tax=Clostridium yunnanense TaxID=2800325 RepID=A0ABS1EWZ4_9CLOT|nr:Ger(x)C family spore germination protein [Clostridium yunnanense]MBK1813909.1 Ger(x)C family spore germination protein [Clostridium yunnanense]
MKRLNRMVSALLIICLSVGLTGCYNYRDINRATFVTSIIYDIDENKNTVLYLDCVMPYRSTNESSEKGRRMVFKGQGKTVLEAMRNASTFSSFKLNMTQCRAYIFSERAAKEGVGQFIDIMARDQEFLIRPYVFVFFGQVEDLFTKVKSDEEYLGIFLNDLVYKMKSSPRTIATNLNDYLTNRINGGNVAVLGGLEIVKDIMENRVQIKGGAILKNDKLAAKLSIEEALSYSFLSNNVQSGTLEINNPQNPDQFITLEILNSKTKTDLKYDGERIKLYKTINIRCDLAESQGRLIVDRTVRDYIKSAEEQNVKKYLNMVFDTYKLQDLDVFKVGRLLEEKYPNANLKGELMEKTDLILDVNVNLEGPSVREHTF